MKTPASYDQTKPNVEVSSPNSDTFASRIETLISIAGSNSEFARLCDVSDSVVRKWRKGESDPSRKHLISITKAMNVSLSWLAAGEGPMRPGVSDQPPSLSEFYDEVDRSDVRLGHSEEARLARMGIEPPQPPVSMDDYYYLPLYDVRASAGHGALNHTEDEVDRLAFKRSWIRKELGVQPDQLCLIYIVGESMEPTLHADDVILIDRSVKEITTDGIYVLMLDGNLLTKRCQRLPGRKIRVSSDNPAYEPFILDDEMHTPDQHLIGRVVWAGRKF